MSPEIWEDIRIRVRNLRGAMLVQWSGDQDNAAIGSTVQLVNAALRSWEGARPLVDPTARLAPPEPTE